MSFFPFLVWLVLFFQCQTLYPCFIAYLCQSGICVYCICGQEKKVMNVMEGPLTANICLVEMSLRKTLNLLQAPGVVIDSSVEGSKWKHTFQCTLQIKCVCVGNNGKFTGFINEKSTLRQSDSFVLWSKLPFFLAAIFRTSLWALVTCKWYLLSD